jgi:alpha-galactosidase
MKKPRILVILTLSAAWALSSGDTLAQGEPAGAILTPPAASEPRINGACIFGARPNSPFLYTIPATGDRPMVFSAENLPAGLELEAATGRITGSLKEKGEYRVTLRTQNVKGVAEKPFRIVIGDQIALTPPMGWNSWACWAGSVDQEKILRAARALVASGLINHGYTYVNIDDTWQGLRSGQDHALQGNKKFPDLKKLCDEIHQMGLKAGIYSTPWVSSFGGYPGGSSDDVSGSRTGLAKGSRARFGKYSFAQADANQWAAWGIDYLKYDWHPIDLPHVIEMSKALRQSGRDIVFSLSSTAAREQAADWARWANSWRTTDDDRDAWIGTGPSWQYGISEIGFNQDAWAQFAGPGHWNDPDMLVVGKVAWREAPHTTHLTADEQYTQISLWCLLSAPLLISANLDELDPFTLNLLSNDDVLALDQDALGKPAVRVATLGSVDVYLKNLEDGSVAVGFFNRDSAQQTIVFNKLVYIGLGGHQHVRDLWRQTDLPDLVNPPDDTSPVKEPLRMTIAAHGVQLYRFTAVK